MINPAGESLLRLLAIGEAGFLISQSVRRSEAITTMRQLKGFFSSWHRHRYFHNTVKILSEFVKT
jgi:hypothetical protein